MRTITLKLSPDAIGLLAAAAHQSRYQSERAVELWQTLADPNSHALAEMAEAGKHAATFDRLSEMLERAVEVAVTVALDEEEKGENADANL